MAIEYTKRMNYWGTLDSGEQNNHILQKAVALYIARPHTKDAFKIEYGKARIELLDDHQNDSDDEEPETCINAFDQLEQLQIGTLPQYGEWIEIESGFWFQHSIRSSDDDGAEKTQVKNLKEQVIDDSFKAETSSVHQIDEFLERAFMYYKESIKRQCESDTARYMYVLWRSEESTGENDEEKNKEVKLYKKYRLAEEKSFESLFFRQKAPLIELLNKFQKKTGKFAIKGFPHKLGVLLYGPPGTGKTSLIKAIAQHTNRHIVSISLAKIKTNQELMDCMFDKLFRLPGEDVPNKLSFHQIVFVMEDIDCASSVVHTRKETVTVDEQPSTNGKDELNAKGLGPILTTRRVHDKLNLAGILNVLDGVVDSPDRIVIMTTNHPEKLDPALIRPGRINKKIMLGYMESEDIVAMIEHFFALKLTQCQKEGVFKLLPGNMTPAEIEQACAEYLSTCKMLMLKQGKSLFLYYHDV